MRIDYYSMTGRRKTNEDSHKIINNLNNKNKLLRKMNIYGLYDGHGGRQVSIFLKNNLDKYFINKNSLSPVTASYLQYKKYIIDKFHLIQKKLIKEFGKKLELIGSTALLIIHFRYSKKNKIRDKIYVANTGDCRAILLDKYNNVVQLTNDHKPYILGEKERIKKLGGKIYRDEYGEWRIEGLSVSRSFGDLDAVPYVTHIPEITRYSLKKDKFIIIACDGLWDVLSNKEAVKFVLNLLKMNKKNIAKKLANYAYKKKSYDNISVIIIFLD